MNSIRILVYHGINRQYEDLFTVQPEMFDKQMSWLHKAGYIVSPVEEMLLDAYDHKKIVVTFDDGYEDNYFEAFSILKQFGFRVTIYLVSDYIGQTNFWDNGRYFQKKLLSVEQIMEMERYGIRFGSHTRRHTDLRKLQLIEIENDLKESKANLERLLTKPVESFSYPWGRWRPEYISLLQKAGYKCAVAGATYGKNKLPRDQYKLHRIEILSTDSMAKFVHKVKGYYFWKYYQAKFREEWGSLKERFVSRI